MSASPPRIVFFGLPGAFAARPLEAMVHAGLAPRLVVEGLERDVAPPRDDSQLFVAGARPSWWRRRTGSQRDVMDGLVGFASELGLDAVRTGNANAHRTRNWLTQIQPDLFVVCGFHHLLSPALLALPRCGGLNLHPGALPAERGPAPLFWALKSGRTDLTWTIHVLDTGEDSGDVVQAGAYQAQPGQRGLAILEEMAVAATPALIRAVRGALDGDLVRSPQPAPNGLRAPRPSFRDGRIDPGRSAQAVYTFVAGCAGRYSMFLESAGDRYFIEDARSYDPDAKLAFEYALTGDILLLRCSPGVVELRLKEDGALFSADY